MNIALIGASGHAGSRIQKELSDRGQTVRVDCAVALVDEIQRPAHSRRRFTVGD
jgi:putative NADH-flavin reductase